jgi:hypothetical protein
MSRKKSVLIAAMESQRGYDPTAGRIDSYIKKYFFSNACGDAGAANLNFEG